MRPSKEPGTSSSKRLFPTVQRKCALNSGAGGTSAEKRLPRGSARRRSHPRLYRWIDRARGIQSHALQGTLPNGEAFSTYVRVTTSHALVMLKL